MVQKISLAAKQSVQACETEDKDSKQQQKMKIMTDVTRKMKSNGHIGRKQQQVNGRIICSDGTIGGIK